MNNMDDSDIFGDKENKWSIPTIASTIMLCCVVTIVGLVSSTPSPLLRLESASVSHLNYSTSPTSFFSIIMNGHLSLKNRFFGRFDYHANKNVTALYENSSIGDGVVSDGIVKGTRTKEIDVSLNLSSENIHVLPIDTHNNFSKDIASGLLNLTISTELRGTKYAFNLFKKKRTVQMACIFRLNFTSSSIDDIQCS